MEILTTKIVDYDLFYGILAIFLMLSAMISIDYESIFLMLLFMILAIVSFIAMFSAPMIVHEVTVTDFNEVYEQGYDIKKQRGEIYTIEKEYVEEEE